MTKSSTLRSNFESVGLNYLAYATPGWRAWPLDASTFESRSVHNRFRMMLSIVGGFELGQGRVNKVSGRVRPRRWPSTNSNVKGTSMLIPSTHHPSRDLMAMPLRSASH